MRSLILMLSLVLPTAALAQANELFSEKAPTWREEDLDRKFLKSKIHRGLREGTENPACAQVLGGLLTALGEAGLMFHQRDQDIHLDPALLQVISQQMSTPRFTSTAYFLHMVRRVLIEKRLPKPWLETAMQIAPVVRTIDLAKLRYLADGVRPVDSFHFSLPMLRYRYDLEVARALSTAKADADSEFRNAYLDREINWEGLVLADIRIETPKAKKGQPVVEMGPPSQVAHLTWTEIKESGSDLPMFNSKRKGVTVKITAKLQPDQYLELSKLPKGTPVVLRGRLWDVNKNVTTVEVRDAFLFLQRDWTREVIADPNVVATCPLAVNDLTGVAPNQPGGWGTR